MGRAGIYSSVTAAAAATPPARLAALPSEAAGAAEGCARPGLRCWKTPHARAAPTGEYAGPGAGRASPAAWSPASPAASSSLPASAAAAPGPQFPPRLASVPEGGMQRARQGKVSGRGTVLRKAVETPRWKARGEEPSNSGAPRVVRDIARTDLELSSLD